MSYWAELIQCSSCLLCRSVTSACFAGILAAAGLCKVSVLTLRWVAAAQVSLPMLAPLLLGTGMLFRSIKANASFLFPRIGLVVVLLWVLWFANSVVQSTVHYLQRQGAVDHRISSAIITGSELTTMLGAGVIVLSALGVNVSGLLLPAGVCLAIAARDLAHNFLAGAARNAQRLQS